MKLLRRARLIPLALVSALTNCGDQQTPSNVPESSETKTVEPTNWIFSSSPHELEEGNPGITNTVALVGESGICSGALIATDVVLTSARCFYEKHVHRVYFGPNIRSGEGEFRPITAFGTAGKTGDVFPNRDVSWLRFEGKAPEGYKPLALFSKPKKISPGMGVTLVGFDLGNENHFGRKLSTLSLVHKYANSEDQVHLIGIGPLRALRKCAENQGGVAYVKEDKKWLILGISNGNQSSNDSAFDCERGQTTYTYVNAYKRWIEKTANIKLK